MEREILDKQFLKSVEEDRKIGCRTTKIPKENYSKVVKWEELSVPKPKSKLKIRE